jgi:hypothetical protein
MRKVTLILLSVALISELVITYYYLSVAGGTSLAIFVYLGVLPFTIALFLQRKKYYSLSSAMVVASLAFFVGYEIPNIYQLNQILFNGKQAVEVLNQYSREHGHAPESRELAEFAFSQNLKVHLASYEAYESAFAIVVDSPDPSKGYELRSDGSVRFIDD